MNAASIHPTALIHPNCRLDSTVRVGPFAVIDEEVVVGPYCTIGPHAYLTGRTDIGAHNHFHAGCAIGDAPQDRKYQGEPTRLVIGDHNVFREHVTVHRANNATEATSIGSNNYLMANSHVGHNARLGNDVILANGALLGGHVVVEDRAFISGNCLVHQFVRVGTLSLMQGGSAVSKDLPPYTIAMETNLICGLNWVGLRRAGFPSRLRTEIKGLYHLLFRDRVKLSEALERAASSYKSEAARVLIEFVARSTRGVCADAGRTPVEEEGEAGA